MGDVYAPIASSPNSSINTTLLASWWDETTNTAATALPGVNDTVVLSPLGVSLVGGLNVGTIDVTANTSADFTGATSTYTANVISDAGYLSIQGALLQASTLDIVGGTLDISQGVDRSVPESVPADPVAASVDNLVMVAQAGPGPVSNIILGANSLLVGTLLNGWDVAPHGTGNTYDPARFITGTGTIYDQPGAAPVSHISTASLNFGIVHVGDVVQHSVTVTDDAGDSGGYPMHGEFMTNGLSDAQLSATGYVTPPSGINPPLAQAPTAFTIGGRGGNATMTVTLAATHAGVLTGQSVEVASQFGGLATTDNWGFDQTATVPITGTVLNYAAPAFTFDGGALNPQNLQTGSAGNSAVYLGEFQQGQSVVPIQMGLQNVASGPADLLSAITWVYQPDVTLPGTTLGPAWNIATGQGQNLEQVAISTATPGWHETTLVADTYSSHAGYLSAVTPVTMTLWDFVAPTT